MLFWVFELNGHQYWNYCLIRNLKRVSVGSAHLICIQIKGKNGITNFYTSFQSWYVWWFYLHSWLVSFICGFCIFVDNKVVSFLDWRFSNFFMLGSSIWYMRLYLCRRPYGYLNLLITLHLNSDLSNKQTYHNSISIYVYWWKIN